MSQSSSECLKVTHTEDSSRARFVQLGFIRRYDEAYVQKKSALDAGRQGRALMMHNFHRNVETPASDFTGAMAISNSAPYQFDVVRHMLGTEYASIIATQPKRSDALVAPVCMTLQTTVGQVITIEIKNNAPYGYDVWAQVAAPPIVEGGMAITFRPFKVAADQLNEPRLLHGGLFDLDSQRRERAREAMKLAEARQFVDLMWLCVEERINVLISGARSTGKTTFARSLLSILDQVERILTIEDA